MIEFFDQLTVHRADAEAVTRATAVLAETVAGVVFHDTGEIWAVTPDGTRLSRTGPDARARVSDLVLDDQVVGRVWLGEPAGGDGHEWDELIISRMSLALAFVFARSRGDTVVSLGLADPALVHVLLRDGGAETETARAARLLGFTPGEVVRVLAVDITGRGEAAVGTLRTALVGATDRRAIAAALSGTLAVAILVGTTTPLVDGEINTPFCVGPAVPIEQAANSWQAARRGLRFTALPGHHWTTTDGLGCLLALADLDAEHVLTMTDIQAIGRVREGRQGHRDLELLESITRHASVREAAAALHMHHSSVAYRLAKLSDQLGYDVRSPEGRYRVATALLLWRLFSDGENDPRGETHTLTPRRADRGPAST